VDFSCTNEAFISLFHKSSESNRCKIGTNHFSFNILHVHGFIRHAVPKRLAETQPSYEEQYEYDMPVGTKAP
jgi:hypothetical protein